MTLPISGTGKRTAAGRFMEDPQLYRTIAAAGDPNVLPATIEAIEAVINTKEQVNYAAAGNDVLSRRWAVDNSLHLQIVIPTSVTSFDIAVFGTLIGDPIVEDADRWAYVFQQAAYTRSQFITLKELPCGHLKVLATNIVGSGSIKIFYSLTD